MRRFLHLPIIAFVAFLLSPTGEAHAQTLNAVFNTATDVPVTANGYTATGTINLTLNFAPVTGASLKVINNTGLNFIQGTFSNLAQWQVVTLTFNGISYHFVANYYGGTGNDLVLQWAANHAAAWGANSDAQLGDGNTLISTLPVSVIPNTLLSTRNVMTLSAGGTHSLALCSDGTVGAWGEGDSGQLGNGTFLSISTSPVAVSATSTTALFGKTVVALAAGSLHNLALCSDGTLASWGSNNLFQLGNASNLSSDVAVNVLGSNGFSTGVLTGKTAVAIAAGTSHSVALCSDGTVTAWGSGINGQLGNGSFANNSVPVQVTASGALLGKTVTAIAAGNIHTMALCSDGTVAVWGDNTFGELGNGTSVSSSNVPVAVSNAAGSALFGKTVIAIAAGGNHCLALCSDGTVAAWGSGTSWQLGNGLSVSENLPVSVTTTGTPLAGKTVIAVAAGLRHSMAQCSDGTLAVWGFNTSAQFGNGGFVSSSVPVAVGGSALAPGETFMLGTTGQGSTHSLGLIAEPPYPVAITQPATAITATSATLNSNVNPGGNGGTAMLQWGLTTSYGSSTIAVPSGNGFKFFFLLTTPAGLSPHTTYHYRVTATNVAGSANGADVTFTTLNTAPVAHADTMNNVSGPATIPVLSNDTDADGDTLSITGITQGTNGSVSTNGSTVTYTPGSGFPGAGSDTFSYTISDGFGGTATGTVSVYASGIQGWKGQTFGANAGNAAISGDNADPNGNGIPNLMEYALHGDAVGSTSGSSILPQSSSNPTTGTLQLSFTRYQDRTDITLIVQANDSLTGTWTNLAQSVDGAPFTIITAGATVNESGSSNAISVTVGDLYQMNDPAHPHRFMRLQVTRP